MAEAGNVMIAVKDVTALLKRQDGRVAGLLELLAKRDAEIVELQADLAAARSAAGVKPLGRETNPLPSLTEIEGPLAGYGPPRQVRIPLPAEWQPRFRGLVTWGTVYGMGDTAIYYGRRIRFNRFVATMWAAPGTVGQPFVSVHAFDWTDLLTEFAGCRSLERIDYGKPPKTTATADAGCGAFGGETYTNVIRAPRPVTADDFTPLYSTRVIRDLYGFPPRPPETKLPDVDELLDDEPDAFERFAQQTRRRRWFRKG